MKGCAIAFNIVGLVSTIVVYSIYIPFAAYAGLTGLILLYVVLLICCLASGISALVSLAKDEKLVFIGVMSLLFNGLVGGILYLCWNPSSIRGPSVYLIKDEGLYSHNRSTSSVKQVSNISKQNNSLEDKAFLLRKYKDLLDDEVITKEEYDKIKSQIFNDEEITKPNSAKSSDTVVPEFNVESPKAFLKQVHLGAMLTAKNDFTKGNLKIYKGNSCRYSAHYANTYQIIVDGEMYNLSELEFVYIFLKDN